MCSVFLLVFVCDDCFMFGVYVLSLFLRPRMSLNNLEGLVLKEIVFSACFSLFFSFAFVILVYLFI